MSRSFDSRSLTTLLSIAISPSLISSRPASMRSNVDLPQPEGPTSTTNSPSAMSKLMPWMTLNLPKFFCTLRKETEAMAWVLEGSALDGAGGEAGHHVALEGVVDRRRRRRVDQAGGHQQLPGRIVGGEEVAQRHRQGDLVVVREQQEGVEVLVPGQQQRIRAHRHQRRHHQR